MNNSKKNETHQIDEMAQQLFHDFQVPPPSSVWKDIESTNVDDSVDLIFQRQFKYLEVTPPDRNWKIISKRIIFPPIILRHLSAISRIAAIFILGLSIYHYSNNLSQKGFLSPSNQHPQVSKSITFGEAVQQNKALQKENLPIILSNNQVVSKEDQRREEVQMLLSSLLADHDFPDSLLDLESLTSILEPLEPLPVFSAMASAAENEKIIVESLSVGKVKNLPKLATLPTMDLMISIPLRVVEEHEIEHLLKMYDLFEQQKNESSIQ